MYSDGEENRFLEVTYANGDREVLYFKDFSSGAMIENIVRRAKKDAIKRQIAGGAIRYPSDRPPGRDQAGVPRARRPAQHHQSRRLGQDLGQEGRADRLRPDADRRRSPKAGSSKLSPAASTFRPMAIHKVLGTETEYGITVRGSP